jgi:stage V sporulation protein G
VQISEVRIKLVSDVDDRLRAFCSITFDGEFVVRDLKIIQGQRGHFVAMPSRKLMEKCVRCSAKNDVKARYCSHCGVGLPVSVQPEPATGTGRNRMFADIAHPINPLCRERIETAVLTAFEEEKIRSKQPGYICRYDDFDDQMPRLFDSNSEKSKSADSQPAAG